MAMGDEVGNYLVAGRSSSAAKKAEAVLTLWLTDAGHGQLEVGYTLSLAGRGAGPETTIDSA